MIKKWIMIPLAVLILTLLSASALADDVIPTNVWTDFGSSNSTINGTLIPAGTVIDAYDNEGVHCGHRISGPEAGRYVAIQVYGDDIETPGVDEGCVYGEHVIFKVNGKLATELGPDDDIWRSIGSNKVMDLAISQDFGLTIDGPGTGGGQPDDIVTYFITVQNTGDGIDRVQLDLLSQHGWQLIDPPSARYVDPGDIDTFTVKVEIPAGSAAGTVDTLTATAQSLFDLPTSSTMKIATHVGAFSGLDATGDSDGSGEPGDTVDCSATVQNLGNGDETVNISLASFQGWTIVDPPDPSYDIDAFGEQDLFFGLELPEDSQDGDLDTLTLIATTSTKAVTADTLKYVIRVVINYGFSITGPILDYGDPGDDVDYYPVTIKNTGSLADNASFDYVSSQGWNILAPPDPAGLINPGASLEFTFTVQIPGDAVIGTRDTLTIEVSSVADPSRTDTLRIVTVVGHYYGVEVTGPTGDIVAPGGQGTYQVTIYNSGNSYDSLAVEVTSSSDWTLGGLPDSVEYFNGGDGEIFLITVDVPGDAIPGDQDTLAVVATSKTEASKSDTLVIITTVDEPTAVNDDQFTLPGAFQLQQNYPNPFNMETVIPFRMESSGQVTLEIYDVLGRKVTTIDAGYLNAGDHQLRWNGASDDSREVSSGIYFYRLISGSQSLTRKMVLLK